MIYRRLREWERLPVAEDGNDGAIPRMAADSLLAAAKRLDPKQDGRDILTDQHHKLTAQQFVGVLAAPAATLEILPKIDDLNHTDTRDCLTHMLARVFDIDIRHGTMTGLGWQQYDLLEIWIRHFLDRLFEMVHQGLSRRYVNQEDDLAALRGRLDVKRQFTTLLCSPQKLACRYDDLSVDIPLNQIMKAAVMYLLPRTRMPESRRRLAELALAFADVRALPIRDLRWDQVVVNRTNSAWDRLLKLAKLLLGERFQTTRRGEDEGFSLMFEMNFLFEEFIGRTIQRAYAGSDLSVRLQGPENHALTDGDNKLFKTRPDIVISRNKTPQLIIDTKWKALAGKGSKKGVVQSDVYQMMAYAQVYQCRRVMLLYPYHRGIGDEDGVLKTYRINGTEDTQLSVCSIKISDLKSLEGRLKNLVTKTIDLDGN